MTEREFPPGGYLNDRDLAGYIPRGELPAELLEAMKSRNVCTRRRVVDTSWMDPDVPPDDWWDA